VAKQAALGVRIADAYVTASRGAFDPVIALNNSRKDYDGITYYDQQWTELKIPTWYGIDVFAGSETVSGSRINPEETKGRINYLGVAVPLLQNVIIDKRRAALQQAKIFSEQSEVIRRAMLNDLLAKHFSHIGNGGSSTKPVVGAGIPEKCANRFRHGKNHASPGRSSGYRHPGSSYAGTGV
jgi:hypothetical protein